MNNSAFLYMFGTVPYYKVVHASSCCTNSRASFVFIIAYLRTPSSWSPAVASIANFAISTSPVCVLLTPCNCVIKVKLKVGVGMLRGQFFITCVGRALFLRGLSCALIPVLVLYNLQVAPKCICTSRKFNHSTRKCCTHWAFSYKTQWITLNLQLLRKELQNSKAQYLFSITQHISAVKYITSLPHHTCVWLKFLYTTVATQKCHGYKSFMIYVWLPITQFLSTLSSASSVSAAVISLTEVRDVLRYTSLLKSKKEIQRVLS